jgi:hypothetical protein
MVLYIPAFCGCSCDRGIDMGWGTICGGGMESTARITGEVDCEYDVVTCPENDDELACCAFVSCSNSD